MTTTTVSIGRNVAGTNIPLADDAWLEYRSEVCDVICRLGELVFAGEGTGFDPTTGDVEVSFTWVANVPPTVQDELRRDLALLAMLYGQDSIAITTGETVFATAAEARGDIPEPF